MKIGIIGLPGSGKTTVFEALTHNIQAASGRKGEPRIAVVKVPDGRVDALSRMYDPQKTTYAQVEYFLPPNPPSENRTANRSNIWDFVKDCDALIHVIRNFGVYGLEAPTPHKDFLQMDEELILSDLMVVEKRLERIASDQKRGKKLNPRELSLLEQCRDTLEGTTSLREIPEISDAKELKGYALLSAKPMLVLFNNSEEDESLPQVDGFASMENLVVVRGSLEHELAQLSEEESKGFFQEFDISASAMDRVIQRSYSLLGLVSFFTYGSDEVRAWTIKKSTTALDAAEVIHSDIKKGFIRAEVLAYDDLVAAGNFQQARKAGTVRLEGKTYEVKDGDIITFRFNV
ncbi:MAG: DUF933 domain-containing protein [Desulfobacterales bacterium]|nr:DUF933 domain-containing protein [Desulfobacterales bacterium]